MVDKRTCDVAIQRLDSMKGKKSFNSLSDLSSLSVVYSTDPNYDFGEPSEEIETLPPDRQTLYISLDKKQRGGKKVTLVENFIGNDEDISSLGKMLKTKCGVGGSVKDGVILVQGDFRDRIAEILSGLNYKIKRRG